jgi:glyoxylase-like metal-dependent hydrolase (beta-lactamase superfamily II)
MLQSRRIGAARISSVMEYSGPTADPAFLFPAVPAEERTRALEANRSWMAPNFWVPSMNRLVMSMQLWVLHHGDEIVVIDTGVGNRKQRPAERMNMLNSLVIPWLEAAGAAPERVTRVINTHLHTDHVGWNTSWVDGRWVPTFPYARYHLPRVELDLYAGLHRQGAAHPYAACFVDSVLPVMEAGLVEPTDPGDEIGGLVAEAAPGHSPAMLAFRLRSQGEEAVFCADIFHNPMQIAEPGWNTRYCEDPAQAIRTRAAFLEHESASGALIMPMHFGTPFCGHIRRQGAGYAFEPAPWPALREAA